MDETKTAEQTIPLKVLYGSTLTFVHLIKVALYTKGSTIYEPTSQYGDLNIL